jgi:hypothetical protein
MPWALAGVPMSGSVLPQHVSGPAAIYFEALKVGHVASP